MTTEQEDHLRHIKLSAVQDLDAKYRQGQKEHGGDIWKKGLETLIVKEIRAEAIDLIVYTYQLCDQVKAIRLICEDNINASNAKTDANKGYHEILTILNGTIKTD